MIWSVKSVSQQIPKMTVTVTTIRVTRFRTFSTPYIQREINRVANCGAFQVSCGRKTNVSGCKNMFSRVSQLLLFMIFVAFLSSFSSSNIIYLKYYFQRKPCKLAKTSTEGGSQNYFVLTSYICLMD